MIPGRGYSDDVLATGALAPLSGPKHVFRVEGGRLRVGAANVVANDVQATNGVVHAIDSVLFPPGLELSNARLVVGFYSEKPSNALAAQLGVDRGESLVVTRITKGDNAERYGLERYDVITAMNGGAASENRLSELKRELGFGGVVRFSILRGGEELELEIPIGLERH